MRLCVNGKDLYESGDDPCHQTTVNILLPSIELGKAGHDWGLDEHRTWALRVDSRLLFRRYKDGKLWCVIVEVLGFGIEFAKQDGY